MVTPNPISAVQPVATSVTPPTNAPTSPPVAGAGNVLGNPVNNNPPGVPPASLGANNPFVEPGTMSNSPIGAGSEIAAFNPAGGGGTPIGGGPVAGPIAPEGQATGLPETGAATPGVINTTNAQRRAVEKAQIKAQQTFDNEINRTLAQIQIAPPKPPAIDEATLATLTPEQLATLDPALLQPTPVTLTQEDLGAVTAAMAQDKSPGKIVREEGISLREQINQRRALAEQAAAAGNVQEALYQNLNASKAQTVLSQGIKKTRARMLDVVNSMLGTSLK